MIINILINQDLWNIIGDNEEENDSPFSYRIKDKTTIILELNNKKILRFIQDGNKKNIIDKSSYNSENDYSSIKEIKTIYNDILNYYNFQRQISVNLRNRKNDDVSMFGYLISKNSYEKWKKYSNYENIKNQYLNKNNKDENNEHNIINNLIYYKEQNKYNYSELNEIEIKSFKNEKEIKSFLNRNSLILIDDFSFINNISEKIGIIFNISNYTIKLILDDEKISFKSNNNILEYNNILFNEN